MVELQQPFNVFKKHLSEHYKLTIHCDIVIYEQEKDLFCFGYIFYLKKKGIYGLIDVHQKEIVYEIFKYKCTQGEGFHAYTPIKSKLEKITY